MKTHPVWRAHALTPILLVAAAACATTQAEPATGVASAASTVAGGGWEYDYDSLGLPTAVRDGAGARTSGAGATDALGRALVRGDVTLTYGPDGQIASATKGTDTVAYVYDETGQRILKRTNSVVAA